MKTTVYLDEALEKELTDTKALLKMSADATVLRLAIGIGLPELRKRFELPKPAVKSKDASG